MNMLLKPQRLKSLLFSHQKIFSLRYVSLTKSNALFYHYSSNSKNKFPNSPWNIVCSPPTSRTLQNRHISHSTVKGKSDENDVKSSFDNFGSWDQSFELPLQMEASIEHGKLIPLISAKDVGCTTNVGLRPYQEDRFFVKDFAESEILCCAVFDGHGGDDCSSFCHGEIEGILEKQLKSDVDVETVLHQTILELHSTYSNWVNKHSKSQRSGSTCTVCLMKGGVELFIGHVGDSRALLCRRGTPKRLTNDHCPSNISERNRIEKSGGYVTADNVGRYMVNDKLSMSRSIGDLYLKSFGVSHIPDLKTMKIKHAVDSFYLLTTDGVNFVLNDSEICHVINSASDPQSAANSLVEQALGMSSKDNLTAIVIPLGAWGNYQKSSSSMLYSFGIGRDMTKSSRFG